MSRGLSRGSRRTIDLRRVNPKLLPFYILFVFYSAIGLKVTLTDLMHFFPENVYDVRKVDSVRFGVGSLFRPVTAAGFMGIPSLRLMPRSGDTVLDAGAHIGIYTLRYSKIIGPRGRVLAFEPEPRNRRILLWNLKLNRANNVEVRKEALGDFSGMANLKISRFSARHSIVGTYEPIAERLVPMMRLDDLSLKRLDLVKIDVEAYEMSVLKGAEKTISSLRPRLQIEVHRSHDQNCDVCNWLQSKGFATHLSSEVAGKQVHWVEASC